MHRMPTFASGRRCAQAGFATVVVMLFLIGTVVFMLAQMLNVSSGNVIDSQRTGDSTAAFFLAESGIEKAQAGIVTALGGNFTNASCTGISTSYSLGAGSVAVAASSPQASCTIGTVNPCLACNITATGRVGTASRTLVRNIELVTRNGVYCVSGNNCSNMGPNSPTWQLKLSNPSPTLGAIGIFALGNPQQGNVNPVCDVNSHCQLAYMTTFGNNGANSVSVMANAVSIPAGPPYTIFQMLQKNNGSGTEADVAEVGALIQGTSTPLFAGPSPPAPGTASYSTTGTTTGSGTTGTTTDGTATSTSWCYGGDAMVFSYAAKVAGPTAQIANNGLVFNTAGATPQNVGFTLIAKYPTTQVQGVPANFGVAAEIWAATNPNLVPSSAPEATGASSFKARGTGSIGAAWTSGSGANATKIVGTTLTVGSFANYPAQIISVGDTVQNAGGTVAANTKIVSMAPGTTGGAGTYTVSVSQNITGSNGQAWTASSNVLNLSACSGVGCNFAANDVLSTGTGAGIGAGRTITAQNGGTAGGVGQYQINGASLQAGPSLNVFVGTVGTTLYLPAAGSQPLSNASSRIAVKSGAGLLPANTTVTADLGTTGPSNNIRRYTMSAAPASAANALDNATICAGTCAFFNHSTTSTYTLTFTGAATSGWSSGFTCLKGVDVPLQAVTSTTASPSRWTEVVN
jgi:hypothetical protein